MKKCYKILAFLLILCMTATLLPVSGMATPAQWDGALYLYGQTTDVNAEYYGWTWKASTKTLTLSGAQIIPAIEDPVGIILPHGSTILLTPGTQNTIRFHTCDSTYIGVLFAGENSNGDAVVKNGTIKGGGSLYISSCGFGITADQLTATDISIKTDTIINGSIISNQATIQNSKINLDAYWKSADNVVGINCANLTAKNTVFDFSGFLSSESIGLFCAVDQMKNCTFNTLRCLGTAVYMEPVSTQTTTFALSESSNTLDDLQASMPNFKMDSEMYDMADNAILNPDNMANVTDCIFNAPCQANIFNSVAFTSCQFNLTGMQNGIYSIGSIYDDCYFNIKTANSDDDSDTGYGILSLIYSEFNNCRGRITADTAAIYGETEASLGIPPFTITDTQILSGGVYTEEKNVASSDGTTWIATIAPEGTAISYDSETGKIVGASTEIVFGVPFSDTSGKRWYYDPIMKAYTSGLVNGMTDTEFGVDTISNRAMFSTLLYRMENEPDVSGLTNPFTDIKAGRYYVNAINWAYAKNIIKGMTDTTVEPEGTLTREQLATMLYRYAQSKGLDVSGTADLSKYTDIKQIHNYAQTAMQWAVHTGIINGMTETTLAPQDSATRAQMITMLIRFMETYGLEISEIQ
jgi:hypothetical protein